MYFVELEKYRPIDSCKTVCFAVNSEFSQKASKEFDSFKQKKANDLKETMASYISLQVKMAKKVIFFELFKHLKKVFSLIENVIKM